MMRTEPRPSSARARMRDLIRERGARVVRTRVRLGAIEPVSASYYRVTLEGDGLAAYIDPLPADAFKLSLPATPGAAVPLQEYGPEGVARWPPGAIEPFVRAYTVRHAAPAGHWLSFDLLDHPHGAGPDWIRTARLGDELALVGFRTDFAESEESELVLVVADASALPAAGTIIEAMAGRKRTVAVIEAPDRGDQRLIRQTDDLEIAWIDHADSSLLDAVRALDLPVRGVQAWVAGESSVVGSIRRHLLQNRRLPADEVHVTGYWRAGQTYQQEFDASMVRFNQAIAAGEDTTDPDVLQRRAFDRVETSVTSSSGDRGGSNGAP